MKRKNLKPMIISALLAVGFGATSVGTSFALFTDHADTSISVTAGIVEITSTVELVNYKSTVEGGDGVSLTGLNSYTNPLTRSSFVLDNQTKTISLNKMVPGDRLELKVTNMNKSNVDTLTRFFTSHTEVSGKKDLFPALKVTMTAVKDEEAIPHAAMWRKTNAVADIQTPELISEVTVAIEFEDHNEGILARDEGVDNAYQDAACTITFSQQAVQGNAAVDPIDAINAYMMEDAMKGNRNLTMHDAMEDIAALNYNASVISGYVWGVEEDQFIPEAAANANYKYFKMYDEMPASPTYSIYAGANWADAIVNLDGVGFDAGESTAITTVNYTDTGAAKSVILRTNGGDITINAEHDTVKHYGSAASLNIIKVAGTSYHEFGDVGLVTVANGRFVLEEESKVDGIYLVANSQEEFDGIKLAVVGEAELPTLARANVALAEGQSKLVVEVQTLEKSEDEPTADKTEYVWIKGTTTGSESVVSSSATDATKVVEASEVATEVSEDVADATAPIASDKVARIGFTGYDSLPDAITAAKDGEKVVLLKDVAQNSSITLSKNLVLDLGGKAITSTAGTLFNIYSKYDLTIKDSGNAGSIDLTGNKIVYSSGKGFVKVEGGALSVHATSGYVYGVSVGSGSSFEMTGGSITVTEASTSTYNYCVQNSGNGNVTISGGTLIAKASGGNYVLGVSNGTANISGGHFEGYAYASGFKSPYVIYNTSSSVTVNITGGYFRAIGDSGSYSAGNLLEGNASISGGYFGGYYFYGLPSSAIATGYKCIENTDAATKTAYKFVVVKS